MIGVKQQNRFIFFGLFVVAVIAAMVSVFWNYVQDDALITYVYSRNIAEGHGMVFNPGEHVQGTTTPLWSLLMAGVYRVVPDLIHAGNLLGGFFLAVAVFFVLDFTRDDLSSFSRLILAGLLISSPWIYVSLGMETLLYIAILMLGFDLWSRERRVLALLTAAALTWTRADGAVLAGTFGLLMLYDTGKGIETFSRTVRAGVAYLGAALPWFAFAWLYFGSPLPNTLGAKQAIFESLNFLTDGTRHWESFYGNNPLSLLIVVLVPVGAWQLFRIESLRPLPVWAFFYTLGYTILNVTNFWYYTPLLTVGMILAVCGGEQIVRFLGTNRYYRRPAVAALAVVGLLTVSTGIIRSIDFGPAPLRMHTYRLVGEWINQNTAHDTTLTVGDLGVVGYYAQRYTRDSFGLIVPDMYYKTPAYATMKYKQDLVAAPQLFWNSIMSADWFTYHYRPLTSISTADDYEFSPMTIFARRLPLETPDALPQGYDLPLTCIVKLPKGAPLPQRETTARLLDSESSPTLVKVSHPFLWNLYPSETSATHETLVEQIALPLTVTPGRYSWRLTCADDISTGTVTVLPVSEADGYTALDAEWKNIGALRGYVLPDGNETWSGGSLSLALALEPQGSLNPDYSIFAHLINADGMLVAQADSPPRSGTISEEDWRSTDIIVDIRQITLPPDLPEGAYQLLIGWYDWRTGERLRTTDGEDHLVLTTITNRFPGGSGLP